MSKFSRKMQLCAAFAAFFLTLSSIGCDGFFVDPTLTGITVTPQTPTVVAGNTLQLTATGSYDDGSTKNITGSVTWTSSDNSKATVSSAGLLTGVAVGTSTITASSATITSNTTVTVQVSGLQSITISPTTPSILQGTTQQFMATAHLQDGSSVDITDSATWTSSNTDVAEIDATGLATGQSVSVTSTTLITATSGTVQASVTLTVNP